MPVTMYIYTNIEIFSKMFNQELKGRKNKSTHHTYNGGALIKLFVKISYYL